MGVLRGTGHHPRDELRSALAPTFQGAIQHQSAACLPRWEAAMTLFDGLLIILAVGLVIFELRHDAGRALLDAVGTLVSAHLSRLLAPALTDALHWKPFPGTETSPLAQGLLFLGLWLAFLGLSG